MSMYIFICKLKKSIYWPFLLKISEVPINHFWKNIVRQRKGKKTLPSCETVLHAGGPKTSSKADKFQWEIVVQRYMSIMAFYFPLHHFGVYSQNCGPRGHGEEQIN